MKTKNLIITFALLAFAGRLQAAPITAFTYQGQLNDGNNPVTGLYDLYFWLYTTETGGTTPYGLPYFGSPVTNGLFTVTLDFGDLFNGNDRWLEIWVKTNNAVTWSTLVPRQRLTAAPYAIYAPSAGTAVNLSGSLPGSQIADGSITGLKIENGTITVADVAPNTFWQLAGNGGTTAGPQFLGTTDNQPLEIKVNGARALRIEPAPTGPSLAGGRSDNSTAGADAAVISGGFANTVNSGVGAGTIGGGRDNVAGAHNATIAGGRGNHASGLSSAVGGGFLNTAGGVNSGVGSGSQNSALAEGSFIGGGEGHMIMESALNATISGGISNYVSTNVMYSAIGGGQQNAIHNAWQFSPAALTTNSVINGGAFNVLFAANSVIGGGTTNTIGYAGTYPGDVGHTIGGGEQNRIGFHVSYSTIGGGRNNFVDENETTIGGGSENTVAYAGPSFGLTIGGGRGNYIQDAIGYATISGGYSNKVVGAGYGTVPGGRLNEAIAFAFAAGNRAKATQTGAFVWADSTDADFPATAPNQFLVRASGGVGLGTTSPTAQLDVNGDSRMRGLFRSGVETGNSETPNLTGMVVRRINQNSASYPAGTVIARTDTLTLERDGTAGGWRISYQANPGFVAIAFMGMDNTGAQRNFYTTLANPSTAGTVAVYANALNVVHFQGSFGYLANPGHHVTQVTLTRYGTDYQWVGTLMSTYNQ